MKRPNVYSKPLNGVRSKSYHPVDIDSQYAKDLNVYIDYLENKIKDEISYNEEEVLDILDIILSEYKDSLKNKTDFYPALRFEQFKKE